MVKNQIQRVFHTPVLVERMLEYLVTDLSGIYVDGTVGGGGHGEAILRRLNRRGRFIGIDRDREAVDFCHDRFSSYGDRVRILHGDFGKVDILLEELGITQVDGFFLDLGLSFHQIDTPERGFSYLSEGPLDMRMDASVPGSAKDIVNGHSEKDLGDIFLRYGEERSARRVARRIVRERRRRPIETTKALADVIRKITPVQRQIKTLARIFQALRIEVNRELEQLKDGLERVYPFLKPGGRVVVISYHSLEDRVVKRFFRGETPSTSREALLQSNSGYRFHVLTHRVVRATQEEIQRHPTGRSARLRAAEKIEDPREGDSRG